MIVVEYRTDKKGNVKFGISGLIPDTTLWMYRPGIEELQREISNALTSLDKE